MAPWVGRKPANKEGILADAILRNTQDGRVQMQDSFVHDATVAAEPGLPLPSVPGAHWSGTWLIGAGAFGNVGLLIAFDPANDTIQERIVVKEVLNSGYAWYDPTKWTGFYDANGHRDYSAGFSHDESTESLINRKLTQQNASTISVYRGRSRVDQNNWSFRIYNAYCTSRFNLDLCIWFYRTPEFFPDASTTDLDDASIPDVLIPEPFVWYCFESLVKAAIVMERGTETGTGPANWDQIVHCDLKPANILLDDPQSGDNAEWRLYPQLRVADFGHAIETNVTDPVRNNPRAYRGRGDLTFYAPEQCNWIHLGGRHAFDWPRLESATNVYQIGLIIYALIYRENEPFNWFERSETPSKPPRPPANPTGKLPDSGYSEALMQLMWDCLEFAPNLRPGLDELSARIRPPRSLGLNLDQGMRTVTPNPNQPWWDNDAAGKNKLRQLRPKYDIGLARDQLS